MNIFNSAKYSQLEEELYEKVAEEIINGDIDKGLWAKAYSKSSGDDKSTRSLYIKYKVEKLSKIIEENELAKNQERKKYDNLAKQESKNRESLRVLTTTVNSLKSKFNWLFFAMLLVGLALLVWSYISHDGGYNWIPYFYSGIIIILATIYLLFLSHKNKKEDNPLKLRKYLNIMFTILIPFSLVIGLGALFLSPLIGVLAIIIFVRLIISAYKFDSAFKHAKNKKLI